MAVLRQRHSCRERRRFVRPVPELCLLQGVYPDEAQVCRAGLPASSYPTKRVFLVRDIAGEDRVLPGDQVSDRERAPVPDVSGSEGRGYGCWPRCLCGKIIIEAAEHGEFGDLLVSQFQRA